jgi:hypothetical protein
MNDPLRGLVLLASVLLWLPVLRPVLAGDMDVAQAALLYLGALGIAWGSVGGITTLVRGYAAAGEAERTAKDAAARRADDISS